MNRKEGLTLADLTPEEQAAAEESFCQSYNKPLALYKVLRQRFDKNPMFLTRCLSYKIEAKLGKRIQISVSTLGATTNDALRIQTLFPLYLLLARPVSTTNVDTQSTEAVYRFKRAKKLTSFGGAEIAKFVICEKNKLSKEIKSGSLEMLVVSCADSSNSQSIDLTEDHMFSNSLNCSGYCLFGKIPMDSLHSSWENAPQLSSGGRSKMKSFVHMKACTMKLSSIKFPVKLGFVKEEKCVSFQLPSNSEAVVPVNIFTEEYPVTPRF